MSIPRAPDPISPEERRRRIAEVSAAAAAEIVELIDPLALAVARGLLVADVDEHGIIYRPAVKR